MRKFFSLAALLLAAVLGLGLATAGSASAAAGAGSWRAYGNTNPITSSSSTWFCGPTAEPWAGIKAQSCGVRSSDQSGVQGAVIVRNNRSTLTGVTASMDLYDNVVGYRGSWTCKPSGVAANSWSVCFGPTIANNGGTPYARGSIGLA